MKKDEKKQIVADLKEKFSEAKSVIATDYKGLNVEAMNRLRQDFRQADVEYRVIKNTLIHRAAQDTDVALMDAVFEGPTALAWSMTDPVSPAKVLVSFIKENDKLSIKSGVLAGGRLLDESAVKQLADTPSREVLLSKMLSAFVGVPTSFVRVLNAVPQNFLNVLSAIKDQKEKT